MSSLGDFDLSTVIYGKFTTYRPSTGAPFTLAGTPALSVYKDNSTTQSTTGVTLTADFDSVTGFNHFAIDTSADGTFYSSGSFFDVVITTGTVDSVSAVGTVVGRFTLRKNSALKPTAAGRTLDVSAGGEAGLDWANVGSPTTTVDLSGTTIAITQKVDLNTIKTQTVTCSGGVTVPAATLASTTNITAGTITTVTTVTNQLTAAQIATGIFQDTTAGDFTAANSIGKSIMNGVSLGTGLTVAAVSGAVGSVTGAVASVTGSVGSIASGGIASTSFASGAITAAAIAADAIGASELATDAVSEIAAGVWDLATSGHTTSGTFGAAAVAAGGAGDPWSTSLPGSYGSGTAGKIIGDNINATISSRASQTSVDDVPTNAELTTALGTADDAVLAAIAALTIPTTAQIATAVFTTQMTESYRATNAAPTLAQAQFELIAHMGESSIASTTKTLKKIDGSTTAKTYTLNDATTPTAITETT